ncbi:MAG TPA: hypothetical protein VF069_16960 [Streptosporangiaceae bacterium]
MHSTDPDRKRRRTAEMAAVAAVAALGAPGIFAAPAVAAPRPVPPATADVAFAYDAPRIAADGEHVTWRWTLRNGGPGAAGGVILVHRITPQLKISRMSRECRAIRAGISCSYGTIQAGRRRTGELEAELRDVSGTVEINGRVTWQQG